MSFGVCFLSWKSHKTLEQSLRIFSSSVDINLLDDAVIYFQEICDEDRFLADKYGFRYKGNISNVGILEGMNEAVSCVNSDIVLYLECDCLITKDKKNSDLILRTSFDAINKEYIDVMRLRSLSFPGDDYTPCKHLRYWKGKDGYDPLINKIRRFLRPNKAQKLIGESCLVHDNPELIFPDYIKNIDNKYYKISSEFINWTNQSIMFRKKWFLETIIPFARANLSSRSVNGFPDLEKELNCKWWRSKKFKIGWTQDGLFTHNRLDRPINDEKINP